MVQLGSHHFSPTMVSIPSYSANLLAEGRASILADIHQDLSLELILARDRYKAQADQHRFATPTFAIGDQVWLLHCHVNTARSCRKLGYKKLDYIIECVNSVTFRLELPPHFRIHNVFHVSLLEPYHPSTIPGRHSPSPPPIELSTGEEYEVDKILDSCWHQ